MAEGGGLQSAIDLIPGKRYSGIATGTLGAPGWPGARLLMAKWFKDVTSEPYADGQNGVRFKGTFRGNPGKVNAKVLYDEGLIELVPIGGGGFMGGFELDWKVVAVAGLIYAVSTMQRGRRRRSTWF